MKISRIGRGRLLGVGLVAAVAIGGAAYAASNTVPASNAGYGTSVVAGFTVTSVAYTAGATDTSNLGSVKFDIARSGANSGTGVLTANADVLVSVDGGTTWKTCTTVAGGHATCAYDDGTLFLDVTSLEVVAYDK